MIGIGTPSIQSRIPRPLTYLPRRMCFTSASDGWRRISRHGEVRPRRPPTRPPRRPEPSTRRSERREEYRLFARFRSQPALCQRKSSSVRKARRHAFRRRAAKDRCAPQRRAPDRRDHRCSENLPGLPSTKCVRLPDATSPLPRCSLFGRLPRSSASFRRYSRADRHLAQWSKQELFRICARLRSHPVSCRLRPSPERKSRRLVLQRRPARDWRASQPRVQPRCDRRCSQHHWPR